MKRILALVAVAVCSPAAGCSILDALQTEQPAECPPDAPFCLPPSAQLTCERPLQLGVVDFAAGTGAAFDLCGQDSTGIGNLCGSANTNGGDIIARFEVLTPGDYELCTFGPPGGSGSLMQSLCDDGGVAGGDGQCLATPGCNIVTLSEGKHFVHWQMSAASACGSLDISINPIGPMGAEGPGTCLDGLDNDMDGLQDCEDTACRVDNNGECQSFIDPELCNGIDDGAVGGFLDGLVDEGACVCIDDRGCDDIELQVPYVCHKFANDSEPGVCAPLCIDFDWCPAFGLFCDPADARCRA